MLNKMSLKRELIFGAMAGKLGKEKAWQIAAL